MPGTRQLAVEVNNSWTYYANPPSGMRPYAFNQEGTIAAIWENDNNATNRITSHRYDFENQSASDSDGILNGIPNNITYTTDSRVGNYAAVFNGSSSYIEFPETYFGNTFSVLAWVYPEEPHTICTIINNRLAGNAQDGFDFYINNPWASEADGSLFFDTGNGTDAGNSNINGNVIPTNEWHHVAIVVNKASGKVNLYINAQPILNQANIRSDFNTLSAWRFGSSINSANYFKGRMDDIRVTSNLLTTAEIQYIAGIPEPSILFILSILFFYLTTRITIIFKFQPGGTTKF